MKKIIFASMLLTLVFASVLQAEEMKTYFPNGKVQTEVSDKGMKSYYENGQVMSQVDYKEGEATGVGKYFYEDGKLMREENFEKKEWKQYGPDGNLMAEGKF